MLELMEKGYWLGTAELFGLKWHVECVEVSNVKQLWAKNRSYQGRIDTWMAQNEHERPGLGVAPNGTPAFYHMEVYAE
jgi:hypothetical protein